MENVNKDKLKILQNRLQKQFDYTYNLNDLKSFFIGVADYSKIILDSDYLSAILRSSILNERDELVKEIDEISAKSVKETQATFAKLQKIIKDEKIDNPAVQNMIKEYEGFLRGDIKKGGNGNDNFATYLIDSVRDILEALKYNGYEEIAAKFALFDNPEDKRTTSGWKISASEREVNKMLAKLNDQKDISVWGAWEGLYWAYASIHTKDKLWDDAVAQNNTLDQLSLAPLIFEMKEILEGKPQDINRHHYFKMTEFKRHIQRVQTKIDSEIEDLLSILEQTSEVKRKESNFSYDSKGAMLFYKDNLVFKLHTGQGKAKLFKALWDNKKVLIDGETIGFKSNPALLRSELRQISAIGDIDKAVGYFRKKLKDLPADIIAQKGFLLVLND